MVGFINIQNTSLREMILSQSIKQGMQLVYSHELQFWLIPSFLNLNAFPMYKYSYADIGFIPLSYKQIC